MVGAKVTVRDAAQLLGVPEKTVYRWVEERGLPVHRVHGQFRFNRAELLEWATSRGVRVSAALFPEPGGQDVPLGGDIVMTVEGVPMSVGNAPKIRDALGRLPSGSPFKVTILRAGEVLELTGKAP